MAEAVRNLPQKIKENTEIKGWDMSTLSGIKRSEELKVKSFPCLVINNKLIFNSVIPAQEELITAIQVFLDRSN